MASRFNNINDAISERRHRGYRPDRIWGNQWARIVKEAGMKDRLFTNIFTPSAQGVPVILSMQNLLNHWVHNINPNFGKLDSNWLRGHGVNLSDF